MNGEFNGNDNYSSNGQMNNSNNQGNNNYSNNNYMDNGQMSNANNFNNLGNNNYTSNVNNYNGDSAVYIDNNSNKKSKKVISKRCKTLIIISLILSLVMCIGNIAGGLIKVLRAINMIHNGGKLRVFYENLLMFIELYGYIMVFVITILSVIFMIIDQRNDKNNSTFVYDANIFVFVFNLIIGSTYLNPFLYALIGLIFVIRNKRNILILVLSIIVIILGGLLVFASNTNFIYDVISSYKEKVNNSDTVIKDEDTSHVVSSFDKIIGDFGDNVLDNKYYKIQNVKIGNTTASLYIDYTVNSVEDTTIVNMRLSHGNKEIYNDTINVADKYDKYFNLSYLKYYDNMVIFASSECDEVNEGICDKHYSYRDVIVFNDNGDVIYTSYLYGFGNDSSVYDPYNNFRVYDIELKGDEILFYTVVDSYYNYFTWDYYKYGSNCNSGEWISKYYDMQRTFKSKITTLDDNRYSLEEAVKVGSITFYQYCLDNSIFNLK